MAHPYITDFSSYSSLAGYLGMDVSPTSLPQCSTLLFLFILIMFKNITLNAIYYYSHTFSMVLYTFSIMYTVWCLTLYNYSISCRIHTFQKIEQRLVADHTTDHGKYRIHAIYKYFNFIPIPFYHSHTLLSFTIVYHIIYSIPISICRGKACNS